jgi:hypothetical protein
MRLVVRFPMVLLLLSISSGLSGQTNPAPDRWIGNWKLNLLKSKFESGTLPKSRTLSFQQVAGGVKATSDLLDEIGSVHIEFTAKYDGKAVPVRGPGLGATISATRTDGYRFGTIQKSGGTVTLTTHYVVSRDGKVLTATSTGTDPDGKSFTNVSLYDRQP